MDGNDTATFVVGDVRYEVDVDGVNRHTTLISRLPDDSLVRLDFPKHSLAPTATLFGESEVGSQEVRSARVWVWTINFQSFGQRYEVTLPQDFDSIFLPETLAELPGGRYVLLFTALEGVDVPLEYIVSPGDELFAIAKAAGRIFKARLAS